MGSKFLQVLELGDDCSCPTDTENAGIGRLSPSLQSPITDDVVGRLEENHLSVPLWVGLSVTHLDEQLVNQFLVLSCVDEKHCDDHTSIDV